MGTRSTNTKFSELIKFNQTPTNQQADIQSRFGVSIMHQRSYQNF